MNILFYQYGSICEPDIIETFEELGFHVDCITEEIENKNITGKEQIALLQRALSGKDYRFIFSINFFPSISELCNIYKLPYLSLVVDSPVMELYSDSVTNSCNRIFLFDRAQYDEFAPFNPTGIFHLPLATNIRRWDEVLSNSPAEMYEKYDKSVSFIGSLYSEKCPFNQLRFPSEYASGYIEGILEAQKKIYGYFFLEEVLDDALVNDIVDSTPDFFPFPEKSRKNYRAALAQYYLGAKITEMERKELLTALGKHYPVNLYTGSDASSLPVRCGGRVKTHTEMPLVFRRSAINLNMTAKSIRSGIPQRVWDVLGCHGFLISNYQTEIPEHLIPGKDLVVYSSADELLELTGYYLNHPKECREIAENGYQKVKNYHTYPIRLTQMLELAFAL